MLKKVISVAALALATSGAMAQEFGTPLPSSVWFDGFCDGISSIVKNGKFYSGVYDQNTFCGFGILVQAGGPAASRIGGLMGAGGVFAAETYAAGFGLTYVFNVATNGTFGITDSFGDNFLVGTWTAGALKTPSGKPALSRQ